jgi:hypothetical protein
MPVPCLTAAKTVGPCPFPRVRSASRRMTCKSAPTASAKSTLLTMSKSDCVIPGPPFRRPPRQSHRASNRPIREKSWRPNCCRPTRTTTAVELDYYLYQQQQYHHFQYHLHSRGRALDLPTLPNSLTRLPGSPHGGIHPFPRPEFCETPKHCFCSSIRHLLT